MVKGKSVFFQLILFAAGAGLAIAPLLADSKTSSPLSETTAQIKKGASLYVQHCASCHGVNGRDAATFPHPIWGPGHTTAKFSNARGLFEYIQLLMPFDDPSKLNDEQKTAVIAYMLFQGKQMPGARILPIGGDSTVIQETR